MLYGGKMSTEPIKATVVKRLVPEANSKRVLLFNPPVYDTRFPWSKWQQPVTLLQLASLLKRDQRDVHLIDALYHKPDERLKRRRVRILTRGEVSINYWRYGHLKTELAAQLANLHKEGWHPDDVYLEGFTTYRWEGVVEAIALVRKQFPDARVILCGAYASLAPEHAAMYSGADIIVTEEIEGLAGLPLDFSVYPSRPPFAYLNIGTEKRSSEDLIYEFLTKAKPANQLERIRQFAFADHDVIRKYPIQFRSLLKEIIDQKIKVSFYALGNIYARNLVDDPELASLLFRAGFKQLVFADDRELASSEDAYEELLDNYYHAIQHCIQAGYKPRTEAIVGSACIGRRGERIEERAAFMTKLAHVAGALIVVPYQPTPDECSSLNISLEYQNGKLFPFAERNDASFRKYQDILGLAAVLNAKYRSRTFDFLGDGLISRLVQSSLVSENWNPRNAPGIQNERPITIGWFNKEGKWVRS